MESLERVSPGFTKQRLSGSVSWDWHPSERHKRLLQAQLRIHLMSSRKAVWPCPALSSQNHCLLVPVVVSCHRLLWFMVFLVVSGGHKENQSPTREQQRTVRE